MMSTRHNGKRSLGSIAQAIHAFGTEATDPFADGLRGRIELARSRGVGHAAIHNGTNHFLSTFRGQARILMSVHSVLRESLRFGNISVPGSDRMDNLPKACGKCLGRYWPGADIKRCSLPTLPSQIV